jgi:phosphotransferase system HPr-like phosphotransfer protein
LLDKEGIMEETKIMLKLDTIKKVNDFVSLVSKYNEEITIKSHRYEINAKSIMGIFSLNLLEAVNVCLYTNDKNIQNQFIKEMNIFKEA